MKDYNFDVEKNTKNCIQWIKDWFENNCPGHNAVIGLSGGKDSTIAAALCAEALGPDRVIGVAMPDYGQGVNEADEIARHLGIRYMKAPIEDITSGFHNMWIHFHDEDFKWSLQSEQNIPPRIRMTMLYAIAQTFKGVVINTCNVSEDYLGYATLFGDSAGSMSPISGFTVTELLQIGDYLELPYKWVHKTPDDGLPHSTSDENKFGFTYKELDDYIRKGIEPVGYCNNNPEELKIDNIKRRYVQNKFKTDIIRIPHFEPEF